MLEVTQTRSNPCVDPTIHIWHGEVAADLFLAALVGGIMVLTAAMKLWRPGRDNSNALRLLPWISPVLISACLLFLWTDLANKANAFRFFLVFKPYCAMSWGSWILLLVYPASLLFAWATTTERIRGVWSKRLPALARIGNWADRHVRGIAIWNLVLGMALSFYTGALLSFFSARPLWNSPMLPLVFFSSGLASAAALMLLTRLGEQERSFAGRVLVFSLSAQSIFIAFWFIGLATGTESGRHAVSLFLGEQYTTAFWAMVVVLGTVIPLMAAGFRKLHRESLGVATAIFVLVGAFSLRWLIIYAGQHSEQISAVLGLGG